VEKNQEKRIALIEKIGIFHEKKGMPPIEGRIIGFLMVSEKEQYSFDEILKELKISKSSASLALKKLEWREIITYTTIPGSRKRYFKLKTHTEREGATDLKNHLSDFHELLEECLVVISDKSSPKYNELLKRKYACQFLLGKLDELIKEFKSSYLHF
jgi:predicted transcriptional regulator